MKVYKFGGASVKDSDGVKNLAKIISLESQEDIVLVLSAMGKTTNALEFLLQMKGNQQDWNQQLEEIQKYHIEICKELFPNHHQVYSDLEKCFNELYEKMESNSYSSIDYNYDQVVSFGEFFSTIIVSNFLQEQGMNCHLLDARQLIHTDSTYRTAKVDMYQSISKIKEALQNKGISVVQGFIGSNGQGATTTLGREGSDYTAAIFASALDLEELTIWKDVDGVYNSDPKIFKSNSLIEQLSYKEAVELAFYGASIIHPKTIQPLQKKKIALRVRSFYHLNEKGSIVTASRDTDSQKASIIVKKNQLLLSLTPRDFSFMDVQNMSLVFQILSKHHHHINLIQNSAISFSVCLDNNQSHFQALIEELKEYFVVRYNQSQVLVTIRHYSPLLVEKIYASLNFKLEQRNRSTFQILISESEFEEKLIPILD